MKHLIALYQSFLYLSSITDQHNQFKYAQINSIYRIPGSLCLQYPSYPFPTLKQFLAQSQIFLSLYTRLSTFIHDIVWGRRGDTTVIGRWYATINEWIRWSEKMPWEFALMHVCTVGQSCCHFHGNRFACGPTCKDYIRFGAIFPRTINC